MCLCVIRIFRNHFVVVVTFSYAHAHSTKYAISFDFCFFLSLFFRRPEIVHVWRDSYLSNEGPMHSAQMVVDGVNYLTETVCNIGAQPSKAFTDWVADRIAPSYWKANAEIIVS